MQLWIYLNFLLIFRLHTDSEKMFSLIYVKCKVWRSSISISVLYAHVFISANTNKLFALTNISIIIPSSRATFSTNGDNICRFVSCTYSTIEPDKVCYMIICC